jgi:hypothetical protein
MKLAIAVSDVGQAPKVEDLAQSEGIGCGGELAEEADTAIWGVPLAPAMRRVALATVESESHLTLPPTWRACYRGVRVMASIVVRVGVRVRVSGGSGRLKNIRITERTQRFILVRAN